MSEYPSSTNFFEDNLSILSVGSKQLEGVHELLWGNACSSPPPLRKESSLMSESEIEMDSPRPPYCHVVNIDDYNTFQLLLI